MAKYLVPLCRMKRLFLMLMLALATFNSSFAQADITRPTVISISPGNYAITLDAGTSVSAVFSEAMNASTINSSTFELRNALTGSLVSGTVTYNAATRTARLFPTNMLSSLIYSVKIKGGTSGVKDLAGNALASDYNWIFIVIPLLDLTSPSVLTVSPANGATGVSLSTQVTATFSEAMNASSINSTTVELRNPANTLIPAAVSYSSTLRRATLTPSAPLAAGTLYRATVKGGSGGVRDANGNTLSANYQWTFTTAVPSDVTPPAVTAVSPAAGATNVPVATAVTATFNEALNAATVNSTTVQLLNEANAVINATVSYNATTRVATLTPAAPLSNLTLYKVKIKGGSTGVKDVAGNALVNDYTWNFTTVAPADVTPPAVTVVSPAAGATGVPVTTTVIATFSEALNAATINTTTVQLLNSSASVISATVSYNAANKTATLTSSASLSHLAVYTVRIKGGSTGVKDVAGNAMTADFTSTFTTVAPPDATPPSVTAVSPAGGSTDVAITTSVTATFSEPVNAATVNNTNVQLLNEANAVVNATVTYNAATQTATLTPAASLSNITLYTLKIKGGSSGVKDLMGNAMATDYVSNFTTVALSIFGPGDVPQVPLIVDQPVELGVKFRASQTGYVKGVRFYKAPGNNGTHIGHLWSSTGTMLAEAVFTSETASGWQQVMFATPVPIFANTTYIASYYSPLGMYGYTNSYFTTSVTNGPIRALASGEDGGNGVYSYGSAPVFPVNSFMATNYYTDVVFMTGAIPDAGAPTVVAVSPPNASTAINTGAAISGVFSESMDVTSLNSGTVELRNAGGTLVNATIAYNANNNSVTLTPATPLANSATYTAKIKGGAGGVKDGVGNALAADYSWTFTTADPLLSPNDGPGGPILVVSTASNPFSRYAVEILRAEGLNEFATADITAVNPTMLANYDVVVLGEMTVSSPHVTMFTNWVNTGGTLIAFKPSSLLNSLFGLTASSGTLSDKYLLVNASGPGVGIVNETIQYHGPANLHNIVAGSGAISLATLHSDANTATNYPAVSSRAVGASGGMAVAFTYDLAKSIVYTRQGNPAWAGQKRDGSNGPIRSDDLFYGAAANDPQADWIDFDKIHIPQADEQQRLLANIILQYNLDRKPLPRFWYLPRDLKAAIVMTGDDHAVNGVVGRFNNFTTLGPNSADDVANWNAVRGTAYIYPNTPITNAQVMSLQAQGFEIALHPHTFCVDYTMPTLQDAFTTQLAQFKSAYPGVLSPATNRTHCLAWSDWASTPKVEYQNGMRLDVTYYNWPEDWMQNIPGMFTGSGMPMRFADTDGSIIDAYQAPTQMTDETNMNYTAFCNEVLDKAVGPEGYYGVFTTNMHTDQPASAAAAEAIIASAQARQVPVISAKQLLTWLDARNGSSFGNFSWVANKLSFTTTARNDARNLKAMLPVSCGTGQLISITRNGAPVAYTIQTIKGIQYAFFPVAAGQHNYVADYGGGLLRTTGEPVTIGQNQKGTGSSTSETSEAPLANGLYVKAMPNPSTGYFNVVINSNESKPVTVRVVDIAGRVVETHQKITSSGVVRLGQNWRAGSYFVEIMQGDRRKMVKLVKVN